MATQQFCLFLREPGWYSVRSRGLSCVQARQLLLNIANSDGETLRHRAVRSNMEYFPGCDRLEIWVTDSKKLLIHVVSSCRLPSHTLFARSLLAWALAHAHHPLYVLPPLTWINIPKLFNRMPVMRPLKPIPAKVDLVPIEALQGHVAGHEGSLSLDNQ